MEIDAATMIDAVEREFDIKIPNTDSVAFETLGELHDYLIQILKQKHQSPDYVRYREYATAQIGMPGLKYDYEQDWPRLVRLVCLFSTMSPDEVTRSLRIVKDFDSLE